MIYLVITAVGYLAGAASAVFLVTVSGIRRGDRPERILNRGPIPRRGFAVRTGHRKYGSPARAAASVRPAHTAARVCHAHDLTMSHRDGQDQWGLTPLDPGHRGGFLPVNSGSWPDGSATGRPGGLRYDHIFSETGLRDRGNWSGTCSGMALPHRTELNP